VSTHGAGVRACRARSCCVCPPDFRAVFHRRISRPETQAILISLNFQKEWLSLQIGSVLISGTGTS
jgi:hypothetical protein